MSTTMSTTTITAAENVTVGQHLLEQGTWAEVVGRDIVGGFVALDLVAAGNTYRYGKDEPVEVADFVGWTVVPAICPEVRFTVRKATDTETCDMCEQIGDWSNPTDGPAAYTVDAEEELGQGGNNQSYCVNHLVHVIETYGPDAGDEWAPPATEREHVILVAFEVNGTTREQAERKLHERLVPVLRSRDALSPVESWWVAEDERFDGSDCDSAVFVKPGKQEQAVAVLRAAGLAY